MTGEAAQRAFSGVLAQLGAGVRWSEGEMSEWGRALGAACPAGTLLALHGDLGAGKTTLVRAMASGLGVSDAFAVTSPTYALVHQYETASGTVVHADFYRVRRPAELDELGWDEMLAGARAAIVEWPEQAEDRLPADAVHLALSHVVGAPGVRALHRLR